MQYYHERYPDNLSAIQLYVTESNIDLPQGVYAFLEAYCCNPHCECMVVKIEIVKQSSRDLDYFETSDTPVATLQYEWGSSLSDENPSFTEEAYQSEWANAAREAFIDYVKVAPDYNEELATRFLLMKVDPDFHTNYGKRDKPFVNIAPKPGRNDPCFCGSGKKYKKCCLIK
jgi:hypothetical protein